MAPNTFTYIRYNLLGIPSELLLGVLLYYPSEYIQQLMCPEPDYNQSIY